MINDRDFENNYISKEVLIQNRSVRLDWDAEASAWVADYTSLVDRVSAALPELLEWNKRAGRC